MSFICKKNREAGRNIQERRKWLKIDHLCNMHSIHPRLRIKSIFLHKNGGYLHSSNKHFTTKPNLAKAKKMLYHI
jgi:hypothetical protein